MCLSCAEGGRRCRDPRRLKLLSIVDLSPLVDEQHPALDWAQDPAGDQLRTLWSSLPSAAVAEAIAVIVETRELEHDTTLDILAALPATARAHGLQFRMKSPASLARKLLARAQMGVVHPSSTQPLREISDRLSDVLRYTAVTADHDELVPMTRQTITSLEIRGYQVIAADHSYNGAGPYKGIHVLIQRGNARPIELQFHSALSQRIKDENHGDYELERLQTTPFRLRAEAARRMIERAGSIPAPAGLLELESLGGCPVHAKHYPDRYNLTDDKTEGGGRP